MSNTMRNATRIRRVKSKQAEQGYKTRVLDGYHFNDSGTREVHIVGDIVVDKHNNNKKRIERVSLTSESRSK